MLTTPWTSAEEAGSGQGQGDRLAAVASVPLRHEAELGGRQNQVKWQIGMLNAFEGGLGEWWRMETASQGLGMWM